MISWNDRVKNEELLYIESGSKRISYKYQREGRLTGFVTSWVGTAF